MLTPPLAAKYEQDRPEAREIAMYLLYFPFKGIDQFYGIGGFLCHSEIFQQIVNIFVECYEALGVNVIAGLDAREFVLGPPIALAMKKPFVMMRKKGKMPNTIKSMIKSVKYRPL
jgi:adenine phosphoribosyltransferase